MATMEAESVHSIVCDPPYEINLMPNRITWDKTGIAFDQEVWRQAIRVLKPGGHLLAFGAARTSHRLVCAIEDAGFEIRDSLQHLFAQGFPKSLDAGKAVDKHLGATRTEIHGVKPGHEDFVDRTDAHSAGARKEGWDRPWRDDPEAVRNSHLRFKPATPQGAEWNGWGTGLKPAAEPIVLARKPFKGTVAENLLKHGVGAINIDACRIPVNKQADASQLRTMNRSSRPTDGWGMNQNGADQATVLSTDGRFPSNVVVTHAECPEDACLEGCPVAEIDKQGGIRKSGYTKVLRRSTRKFGHIYGKFSGMNEVDATYGNTGPVSRFFFVAKPKRSEKEAGLIGKIPCGICGGVDSTEHLSENIGKMVACTRNVHPTVKSVQLMCHLAKLVTPPLWNSTRSICWQWFNWSSRCPRGFQLHRHRTPSLFRRNRRGQNRSLEGSQMNAPTRPLNEFPMNWDRDAIAVRWLHYHLGVTPERFDDCSEYMRISKTKFLSSLSGPIHSGGDSEFLAFATIVDCMALPLTRKAGKGLTGHEIPVQVLLRLYPFTAENTMTRQEALDLPFFDGWPEYHVKRPRAVEIAMFMAGRLRTLKPERGLTPFLPPMKLDKFNGNDRLAEFSLGEVFGHGRTQALETELVARICFEWALNLIGPEPVPSAWTRESLREYVMKQKAGSSSRKVVP